MGIAANTLLLTGETDQAIKMFIESFRLDPENLVRFGSNVYNILIESPYARDYLLVDLELGIEYGFYQWSDVKEDIQSMLEQYESDPIFIKKIQKLILRIKTKA
jgi:tetratricopeptide (TPR) repeat protein